MIISLPQAYRCRNPVVLDIAQKNRQDVFLPNTSDPAPLMLGSDKLAVVTMQKAEEQVGAKVGILVFAAQIAGLER